MEDTRKSYDETVKAFRQQYKEKTVVFRRMLARRVEQPGGKSIDFRADLQTSALKAHPQVSIEIREHLILRGFLEGIKIVRCDSIRGRTWLTRIWPLDKALERALHIEAARELKRIMSRGFLPSNRMKKPN